MKAPDFAPCRYCEHDEPGDLAYWLADGYWSCVNAFFCDLRACARGLETGEHIEGVA